MSNITDYILKTQETKGVNLLEKQQLMTELELNHQAERDNKVVELPDYVKWLEEESNE